MLFRSVSKSLVMWGFPLFQVSAMGDPLVPYRDTNIPCHLGCCFEVLSFAAYPGYPIVPYRDTNIPWDLGCCFEVLSFAAYPGYPQRNLGSKGDPCKHRSHSILYLGQEFRQIKLSRVIVLRLPYVISLHSKRHCMHM